MRILYITRHLFRYDHPAGTVFQSVPTKPGRIYTSYPLTK